MPELELDPALLATLRTLERHDVGFILVGGVAQAIHDQGGFVSAVTIVPEAYARNVKRLRDALRSLDAQLDAAQTGPDCALDYRRADLRELAPCRFLTGEADVDVTFQPGGTSGYQDLFDDAARIKLAAGVAPLVASREDLQRMVRATQPPPAYAQPPAALPPEPEPGSGWPDAEIRASRVTRA